MFHRWNRGEQPGYRDLDTRPLPGVRAFLRLDRLRRRALLRAALAGQRR
jgi:hypothetical protein